MIEGACHCGNVRLSVAAAPDHLTSCNCSLCHRLGALWAYYPTAVVTIETVRQPTVHYVQGDRTLATHHCPTCACVSHWTSLRGENRMGVNARLLPRDEIEGIPVQRLDGADTWDILD